jgi:hypothetical protein
MPTNWTPGATYFTIVFFLTYFPYFEKIHGDLIGMKNCGVGVGEHRHTAKESHKPLFIFSK